MSEKSRNIQPGTTASSPEFRITITEGGPYVVNGAPKLSQQTIKQDPEGNSWNYVEGKVFDCDEGAHLCRCGHSGNAPFCDGTHQTLPAGVLEETASFEPLIQHSELISGPTKSLLDNEKYCAYGRFCDAGERVWGEVQIGTVEHDALATRMAHHCPGGRLLIVDNQSKEIIEDTVEPALGLIEDPKIGASGPIMVQGGIEVISAEGKSYEIRTRQALCRCGSSSNKPFCDGSHASVKYRDGIN
ncbi:CDGSH iron-sulfur domain-containing protein [Aurantimicrobium minutum]|uniref:CDGSH iron-sulfur domain-containing protein n=1 Tax=Aurantimicrobium minutum TaxID=708131 RepID=UPI002473E640|nr:CDGSH iron-sulfur domain-containing protein [Aurantimicrobium minutum]MDH6422277.1 CDGSH-type Zn-finger protein [Aurantimicrobium minutum]